ncbi:hypothetical protein PMAYCL1PPCAC_28217, partial [Pristionchus mayeri]
PLRLRFSSITPPPSSARIKSVLDDRQDYCTVPAARTRRRPRCRTTNQRRKDRFEIKEVVQLERAARNARQEMVRLARHALSGQDQARRRSSFQRTQQRRDVQLPLSSGEPFRVQLWPFVEDPIDR